jgi:hypothetical protein
MFLYKYNVYAFHMEYSPEYICKDQKLGEGSYKQAFTVNICDAGTENAKSDFSSNIDPSQLCIVEFKESIQWINVSLKRKDIQQFVKFKTKIRTDPDFKYTIYKSLSTHDDTRQNITGRPDPFVPPKEYERFFEINCKNINNYQILNSWFNSSDTQFDLIDELKLMYKLGSFLEGTKTAELGGGGSGGGSSNGLAPKLHQIRIDIKNGTVTQLGTPFSPDEIDAKFAEIPLNSFVKISYLVERCGESIMQYIRKNPGKKDEIREKLSNFIDVCVDETKQCWLDFKPANLCPKYNSSKEIVSIQLLDIDTKFLISDKGLPNFSTHAKVFMKFLCFSLLQKQQRDKMNEWYVSREEVAEMIQFFYRMDFMIYEHNPINMLQHYLIPETKFLYYDSLKERFATDAEIIAAFQIHIDLIPIPGTKGGKKRKSKRRKNTRKLMKNRQPLSSRKNNQA